MKKKFSSLHLKRKISDKSLPTFSVGTPDSPASPLTPKSGRSSTKTKLGGELLVDESPRPRAHTTSGRPLGPPIVLTDLQRSPMMKRRARAEGKDSADEDDAEPSEPTADDHHRGNTPSLGSATTPSMSSMDMLHIESDVGSKSESLALSTDDLTVDRSASRSSSRFQIHTAFDWDERDVVHWVRHKLKRDDLSLHFEAKSIDGQQLLSLDSGKMKVGTLVFLMLSSTGNSMFIVKQCLLSQSNSKGQCTQPWLVADWLIRHKHRPRFLVKKKNKKKKQKAGWYIETVQ